MSTDKKTVNDGGWVGTTDGVSDPEVLHDPKVKRAAKKAVKAAAESDEPQDVDSTEVAESAEVGSQERNPVGDMQPCCEADAAKHNQTLAEAKMETPAPCIYCQELTDRYIAVGVVDESEDKTVDRKSDG